MQITVDLKGVTDSRNVLRKFGEVFELTTNNGFWGENWDALDECLNSFDEGGLSRRTFTFPIEAIIANFQDFQRTAPDQFRILKSILDDASDEYKKKGETFTVIFA